MKISDERKDDLLAISVQIHLTAKMMIDYFNPESKAFFKVAGFDIEIELKCEREGGVYLIGKAVSNGNRYEDKEICARLESGEECWTVGSENAAHTMFDILMALETINVYRLSIRDTIWDMYKAIKPQGKEEKK